MDNMKTGLEASKYNYETILDNYIKSLYNELEEINRSLTKHKAFINSIENRKAEINLEIERVQQRKNEIEQATKLSEIGMDGPISTHNVVELDNLKEAAETIKSDVQNLENQKAMASGKERMIIQRKIDYKNEQLKRIYNKRIKLGKRQRSIAIVKSKIDILKNRGIIKQETKVALAESKAETMQAKIDASENKGDILSTLIEKGREVKVSYYKRKAEKAREILNKMDNRSIIKGARAIAILKVHGEKLINRMMSSDLNKDHTNEVQNMVNEPVGDQIVNISNAKHQLNN